MPKPWSNEPPRRAGGDRRAGARKRAGGAPLKSRRGSEESPHGVNAMNGAGAIADILKAEGTEYLFCFPVNALIDACAGLGIRPIVARTERALVNMADGYSRASNGRRIGVATVQHGPGAENAFAGVAQAFADGSPLLFLPGGNARGRGDTVPNFQAADNYRGVTKWSAQVNRAERIP